MDRSKIVCVICCFWATISSTKKSFIDVSCPFRNLNWCGSNELLPETMKKTNMLVDEDDTATSEEEEEMDSSSLGWPFHVST